MRNVTEGIAVPCTRWFMALAALLVCTSIHAAGFYLNEVGTPGSLGTAGAANPTNS